MKNKLIVDFFREIVRNFGRFISIFFIVMLGTAFFAGLRSSGSDMRISADKFYDDTKLMDFKILSTLGLTDEDLADIKMINGVESVEGGHTKEVILSAEKREVVIKLIGITKGINEPYITAGRMPEKSDECLVDEEILWFTDYRLGDKIILSTDDDSNLSSDLKNGTYTITGFCNLPYYPERGSRGTSSVGDGSIDIFIMIPKENFKSDIYTEVYVAASNMKALMTYSKTYEDKIKVIKEDIKGLETKINGRRYEEVKTEAENKLKDAEKKLKDGEKKLSDTKKKIDNSKKKIKKGENKLTKEEKKIVDAENELADGKNKLLEAKIELKDGEEKLDSSEKLLEDKEKEFKEGEEEYNLGLANLNKAREKLYKGEKKYKEGLNKYKAGKAEYEKNFKAYEEGLNSYVEAKAKLDMAEQAGMALPEAKAKLEGEKAVLDEAKLKLDETKLTLDENKETLAASKTKLEEGKAELEENEKALEVANKKLESGKKEIEEGKSTLVEKKAELEDAGRKIWENEEKLTEAWQELSDGKKELDKAKEKLAKSKEKLEKAEKKYNKELPKANKKLEKGRKKLAKAKRDVADIKEPDFYVIDRNMMEGYVSFKQNTERMDSLGNVFPVIFFLVAALVSLTAMTRMVDESRMSMGILKALGYSSLSISMKYIFYALLATLGGGIIGVLLGERFLPLLIIKSYGTLFTGMPYCLTPINYEQALFGLLAAVLSTVVATLFSVLSQLLENPASLMRPLPPSSGRRVILEHIDFIWKRLNFTRKATIRNLARYKKRLIMTVVGIGGCMGLLLVGFGLKDSINEIAKKQYIKIFTYDANIALNSKAKTEEKEELINIINQYNGIDKTIKIKFQAVDLVNGDKIRNTNLFVPEDVLKIKDFLNLKNRTTGVEFDFPSGDGACISEKTAVMLGVNEGDVIKVQQEGKKQVSIKIEKIAENYVFHYLFLSPKLYTKLYGEEPEYNTINLKYDRTGINQQELGAKLLSYSGCSGVYFVDELEENIDRMLRVLDLVVLVLIVAAGLLAFVVLYNLNSINILERKRELATLKVLGFYDNEVSQYVYRENILLTFFGIMVGLIFGTILHRYVIVTVEVDMMMFGRNISIFSYIMSSLITIGFSVLVNLAMYFIIKKIDMTTSLKSVE
ncbi:MAG: FtsX-like permease family protein [Catonella sp.]